MKNACEGVMYPKDAAALVKASYKSATSYPQQSAPNNCKYIKVPHKSWTLCKGELERIFAGLQDKSPKRIFVLAPLHKGPIIGEPFAVYAPCKGTLKGSDWNVQLEIPKELMKMACIQQNDDVCTEEHSLEIIAPYLATLFKEVPVSYLLATGNDSDLDEIKQTIGRMACDSLIFISDDEKSHCASMWY